MILEQMDLQSLMNLGKINRHFARLTLHQFKRIHSNIRYRVLVRTSVIGDIFEEFEPLEYSGDEVIVSDIALFENILKTYGQYVTKVHIEYVKPLNANSRRARAAQSNEVQQLLDIYCSDSLTELIFTNCTANPMTNVTRIFPKVEDLRFYGVNGFEMLNGGGLCREPTINVTFPNVRRMRLLILTRGYPHYTVEFQHLDEVDIKYFYIRHGFFGTQMDRTIDAMNMDHFLSKNPQLRSLNFSGVSLSYIMKLPLMLTYLEALALDLAPHNFNYNEDIRFERVRKYSLTAEELPVNIYFDKLEEVELSLTKAAVSTQ